MGFNLLFIFTLLCLGASAEAKLNIITTTTDLEALVRSVAGQEVELYAVAKGTQDPHQMEAKPSYMVKFRSADLVISQGLDLESAWLVPLIRGARNPKIAAGTKGFLELGPALNPIEVAGNSVSRAEGDVHPDGNPHFQLDPVRLGLAAELIANRLGELDEAHRELYKKNAEKLGQELKEKTKNWSARIQKTGVKKFVSYHKTLSYFAVRFGLEIIQRLEPKPGIPPTASHIMLVINEMKKNNAKLVLIENYFDDAVRSRLENEIPGVKIIKVPVSVGGEEMIKTNADLIERLVRIIEGATQ